MKKHSIIIYTDGSSLGNPGPGGYGCVIVFNNDNKVIELGGYCAETTNNKMELTAMVKALEYVKDYLETPLRPSKNSGHLPSLRGGSEPQIVIHTDSSYAINGITKWVYGWQKNNWMTSTKTPVLNSDLWKELILLKNYFKHLSFEHVRGHAGVWGNERCDTIATSFAMQKKQDLFQGELAAYDQRILTATISTTPSKNTPTKKTSEKAYAYVAQVNGTVQIFKDWESCKAAVHGKSSRYKKVFSQKEQDALIRSWNR